jgi:hypothetical protein
MASALRDDDQPAAVGGRALPGVLDIGKWYLLGGDAQFGPGRPFQKLWYRFHGTVDRDGASATAIDLQPGAPQHGSGQRDGRPGALADLD